MVYLFIRLIRTVKVTVTAPPCRDAVGVVADGAGELVLGRTCLDRTVEFITAITAVIIMITDPALLNTLAVGTCELISTARFICTPTDNCVNHV